MSEPRIYKVKRFGYREEWRKDADTAMIDNFPWGHTMKDDYRPETKVYAAFDDESLFVYMETDEINVRFETKGIGKVHTDSCMEFFLMPAPESSLKYLNWEFNPAGGMHLGIGTCRHDRTLGADENYRDLFQVKTNISDKGWNLEYRVPLSWLKRFFPSMDFKPGRIMRGNFYKCGDETLRPHYGCWSPIDLVKPDFHCPDYFGNLVLEG